MMRIPEPGQLERFERTVLPHLNAAYNLARWLMRNDHDAEDLVQESYLRALRFFEGFQGDDGRAWLLAIVRNTCRSSLQQKAGRGSYTEFEDEKHSAGCASSSPEHELLRQVDIASVQACIDDLPDEYREVIVLRELEQLSYKEIAQTASVPLGTVMSRLSRARAQLQQCLAIRVRGARA